MDKRGTRNALPSQARGSTIVYRRLIATLGDYVTFATVITKFHPNIRYDSMCLNQQLRLEILRSIRYWGDQWNYYFVRLDLFLIWKMV